MEQNKIGFFQRIINSIINFGFYKRIVKESLGKAFGYLVLFSLLLAVVGMIKPIYSFSRGIQVVTTALKEEAPDFTFENGRLEVYAQMPMIFEGTDEIFVIDTSGATDESALAGYTTGILITQDYAVTYQFGQKTQTINFADLEGINFTKESVEKFMPFLNWINILIVIGMLVGTVFGKLFGSLIVSLIGLIANSSTKAGLKYEDIYKLGIYGMTLPSIVKVIVKLLPFGIPVFTAIYYGIVVYYLWKAMTLIKQERDREQIVDLTDGAN